jgi:uncharacterized protein (DUF1330 family)
MSAYVIVDIEATDPEDHKEYIKAAPETLKFYEDTILRAVGQTKPSKLIGAPTVWSFWNFPRWNKPKPG